MKKIFGLITVLVTVALGTTVFAGAFTPGNIVIYRMGDGSQPVTNFGQTVFLDEYTQAAISNIAGCLFCSPATPINTVIMPTNWFGSSAPLVAEGPGTAEGQMTLSQDGRFLVLTGFGATLTGGGSPTYQLTNGGLSSATATGLFNQVARVVGLVDGNGNIYTTTTQTNSNEEADDIRAAASIDGTNIWLAGSVARVKYTTRGSMTSTQVCADTSLSPLRAVNIFGNRLFIDKSTEIAWATNTTFLSTNVASLSGCITNITICTNIINTTTLTGCSTSIVGCVTNLSGCTTNFFSTTNITACATNLTGCTTNFVFVPLNPFGGALPVYGIKTNFAGLPPLLQSAFGMALFNLNGGSAPDTLYLADSSTNFPGEPLNRGGAVLKYCFVGGSWSYMGEIGAEDAYGVAGYKSGQNVSLFITSGTNSAAYFFNDTSGFNAPFSAIQAGRELLAPSGGDPSLVNLRGITPVPVGADSGGYRGATNGPGLLSFGPPFGASFVGPAGGPFQPTNGLVYSFANTGTNTTNFVVNTQPVPWLTVTPSSASVPAGGSVNVTLTANNGTATGEGGGKSYSGNLQFKYANNFGTNFVLLPCTLVVNALYVRPLGSNQPMTFTSIGEPGGPFSPVSATYVLSNATSSAVSWSVFTSNNWTSLSASTGTLGAVSSTNITVSITANANSLVDLGSYQDYLVFSNLTVVPPAQLSTAPGVILQVGFGFFDDFSDPTVFTSNSNVVGQNNWRAGGSDVPVQVTNGFYTVPGGCPNDNGTTAQQPYKYIAAGPITNAFDILSNNVPTYAIMGMSITVTNGSPNPNYIFGFGTTFLTWDDAGILDVGGGQYIWTTELNAYQTGGGAHGTIHYNYGTPYQVYLVSDFVNSNAWVFVNPGTNDFSALMAETPAVWSIGAGCSYCPGASPQGWNSVILGQYSSCPVDVQQGYKVSRVAASTNYADVYTYIAAGSTAPPVSSFTASPTNGSAPLVVNFNDTSTGSPNGWAWSFGDCSTSTNQFPSHTYMASGVYTATLVAANIGGSSFNTATAIITVTGGATDPFASWDTHYFPSGGSLSGAGVDAYGTGMSNTNKFLAGFSGSNPSAYLHIISVAKTNSNTDVRVNFLGANGDNSYSPGFGSRTNRLEYTSGTANGSYSTNNFSAVPGVADLVLSGGSGSGAITNFVEPGGATNVPTRYYRVRVLLP